MPDAGLEPVTYALRVRCYKDIKDNKSGQRTFADIIALLPIIIGPQRTIEDVFCYLFATF